MSLSSYSQMGQDITVANYFNLKRNGYFIDIGAADGITISNTYLLESELDWKGICVEALPSEFNLLQSRRKVPCYQVAAYSQSDLEFEFVVHSGLSGIVKHIDRHFEILNDEKIKVKTKTLTELLDLNNAPSSIDYLSIDTEGSELEVLKGINWNKYSFGYITVEHNEVPARRKAMREFLESKGYMFHRENYVDDDYVRKV